MSTSQPRIVVCALYHFVPLEDYAALQTPLLNLMLEREVRGTLLLAAEGVNGTIAGTREDIDAVLGWLRSDPRLADLDCKESYDEMPPFYRSKVKLKKEIVTMGVEGIDPRHKVGTHVDPQAWNALISDPEVLLIDTRNDYEVAIGTFEGAVNPHTKSFREFPAYVEQHLDKQRHKKVAMFCTGGIRCEKSTAFLKEKGFDEVYHLKGGILNYLEKVSKEDSMWQGECFVFDNRVSVNHALEKGSYDQCHACRLPITDEYERGVSCPHCHGSRDADELEQFRERQRQIDLAAERGEVHLGTEAAAIKLERKQRKIREKEQQHALSLQRRK
jgi:UPF0176 protein